MVVKGPFLKVVSFLTEQTLIIILFQIHGLCYETEGPSSLQMKKRCDDMFWWNIMQLCPPSYTPLFKLG